MTLQVKPMLREDIPRMYEIRDAALLPSEAPISCLLFKGPFTANVHQREIERLEKDSSTVFLKAEGGPGETIAILRARKAPKQPDANISEIKIPPWRDVYPVGPQAWDGCMRGIAELKAKVFDNVPHIYLELIATDPADQKRGAASLLLRQLAEIADEAKQSIHLLATDAARPVYAKNGFEVLDEIVLDLAEMNESKPGRERFTCMVRKPSLSLHY